jgi:hypothetical protein
LISFYRTLYTCCDRESLSIRVGESDDQERIGQNHFEPRFLAIQLSAILDSAVQRGTNLGKRRIDGIAQGSHRGGRCERNQSRCQSVLDQILARLIVVQIAKGTQNISFHSELSLNGWVVKLLR